MCYRYAQLIDSDMCVWSPAVMRIPNVFSDADELKSLNQLGWMAMYVA